MQSCALYSVELEKELDLERKTELEKLIKLEKCRIGRKKKLDASRESWKN